MIAIKDFKMPSCCYDCDFSIGVMSTEVDRECTITEKYVNDDDRPDWCPLVEVPDMNVGNCSEIPNNSDCVSRQAAIDALENEVRLIDGYYIMDDEVINKDDAIEAIRLLPSIQPDSELVTWLLDWIWDEGQWELNWQAFPELLCRKLVTLGYLREKDGEYER